jgi:hypothetical protein
MKQITTLGLSLALAVGFASAVSAQTTSSSAGVLTTSTPTTTTSSATTSSTTTAKTKPTTATADMVNEAIQRSQARAAKEAQTGTPQQWGSEEPFTYDPSAKNFTASQQ